jgi:hypothetical protein
MDRRTRPSNRDAVLLLIPTGPRLLWFRAAALAAKQLTLAAIESGLLMAELVQRRHGTRIRAQIPVRVTSLEPGHKFSERCHTVLVNPYGCGIRFSRSLPPGMRVKVEELPTGKTITARVASNLSLSEDGKYWLVGLGVDSPGNLWCIAPTPPDWQSTRAAL